MMRSGHSGERTSENRGRGKQEIYLRPVAAVGSAACWVAVGADEVAVGSAAAAWPFSFLAFFFDDIIALIFALRFARALGAVEVDMMR